MEGLEPADWNEEQRTFSSHGPLACCRPATLLGQAGKKATLARRSPRRAGAEPQEGRVDSDFFELRLNNNSSYDRSCPPTPTRLQSRGEERKGKGQERPAAVSSHLRLCRQEELNTGVCPSLCWPHASFRNAAPLFTSSFPVGSGCQPCPFLLRELGALLLTCMHLNCFLASLHVWFPCPQPQSAHRNFLFSLPKQNTNLLSICSLPSCHHGLSEQLVGVACRCAEPGAPLTPTGADIPTAEPGGFPAV
ncbi:hypothetical protein Cadr_000002807 [Camelus dromedarius]|uniref:Uncharacterized protein n=1 Tax=Camelus dromedarius TaxID=9838 RepID=A0A5N4C2T6_CAMDR|nr:hypothetical protein Cadr_000002807 [Camelus dromedarius]